MLRRCGDETWRAFELYRAIGKAARLGIARNVEDLAAGARNVRMRVSRADEIDNCWQVREGEVVIGEDARRARSSRSQIGCARRVANWRLAIRVMEEDAARSKASEVWRASTAVALTGKRGRGEC